jgi:predicted PhzF superfamily epimerase YddE/YHI9
MNQGVPAFGIAPALSALAPILARLSLREGDLADGLTARVISTGLPYLIIPVRADALARAAIVGTDLEGLLQAQGAKFILVLDVAGREMRTWDNLGKVEDVATGSAAGPAAAYLLQHGRSDPGRPVHLAQGRFAGRPSRLRVDESAEGHLLVSGEVWPVSRGTLDVNPLGFSSETDTV